MGLKNTKCHSGMPRALYQDTDAENLLSMTSFHRIPIIPRYRFPLRFLCHTLSHLRTTMSVWSLANGLAPPRQAVCGIASTTINSPTKNLSKQ